MSNREYVVVAGWDAEAEVWIVESSDIPGLFIEAETLDQFREVVEDVAAELLEANTDIGDASGVPVFVKLPASIQPKPAAA